MITIMEWFCLPLIIGSAIITISLSWFYWQYLKSQEPAKINVLQHLRLYVAVTMSGWVTLSSGQLVWRILFTHFSRSMATFSTELGHSLINLTFILMSAVGVVRICLTVRFISIHNRDPKDLAHRVLGLSVCLAVPPNLVKSCYELYHGQVVGSLNVYLTNLPGKEQNFSVVIIAGHVIIATLIFLAARIMAYWRRNKNVSYSVSQAEQLTAAAKPDNSIRTSYSLRKFVQLLLVGLLALVMALTKYLLWNRLVIKKLDRSDIIFYILALMGFNVVGLIYLLMDQKMRSFTARLTRQWWKEPWIEPRKGSGGWCWLSRGIKVAPEKDEA